MFHHRLKCMQMNCLDVSLSLHIWKRFQIRGMHLVFQMSPQKKVILVEVRRISGPANAHSCVMSITCSYHTMLKVLCKHRKHVGVAMWMSDILHKPHAIEFRERFQLPGWNYWPTKNGQTIHWVDISHHTVIRSGCSNLSISKWGFSNLQNQQTLDVAIKTEMCFITKPHLSHAEGSVVDTVHDVICKPQSLCSRRYA